MRTLKQADLISGVFLALLGAVTVVAATGIKGVAGETLDPRTLPTIIGWCLIALGLGIVSIGWRYQGDPIYISWPKAKGLRKMVIVGVAMIAYLATLDSLGFAVSTGVFMAAIIWYLGRYKWWICILAGVASVIVIDQVFMELLGLNLPRGILELLY